MDRLYEIAKECAGDVVSTAQCAGYEVNGRRAVFFRSDIGDLADVIFQWLEAHMEIEHP